MGKHLNYDYIINFIRDFGSIHHNMNTNYIITNTYIIFFLEQAKIMSPKVNYHSQYLLSKDTESVKSKIAFVTYDWNNQYINYQYKYLIQNINEDLFETYIFGFKNNDNDNVILLDNNLEKTQHLISECKLDTLMYHYIH